MAGNSIDEVTFMAVIWVCQTMTFSFVFVRLAFQYCIDRHWHINDMLILVGWLLSLGNGIVWSTVYKQMFQVLLLNPGATDLSSIPANIGWIEERYLRGQLASYLLSYTSLWFIKLSFIFFFRKLGNRYRAQRVLWWVVLFFVIACYGVTLGVLDYACEMSSLEESIVIVLSGNVMWKVQINWPKKLALIGVSFLTGFIIVIALVRLLLSVSGKGILNPAWLVLWNAVEICVAIIVACLASFRTFYIKFKRPSYDPNKRMHRFPNDNYASLETPILLEGGISESDKGHRSTNEVYQRVPSPLRLLITITYLAGTGVCNFVGVRSLPEAGSRAALLSSINLIPMFMSGGYEFGARLLGVSLGTYRDFHRTIGFVTVFEAAIHIVIIAKTRQISTSDNLYFYGILVWKVLGRLEQDREYTAWFDGLFSPASIGSYGSCGEMGNYGHVFMVATGIGIAAQLPYIKEILTQYRRARLRTQRISLVWHLEHEEDWEAVHNWLQILLLSVTIYDARSPSLKGDRQRLGHHDLIEVNGGEPNWEKEMPTELAKQRGRMLVAGNLRDRPI
ncbi:hypothetical protein AARAC_008633 [Aspergillus arachidicola]|uniref:Uncharacterized protein n=1 Tax=Aspergillus arachidicola TaxID=656916 RepID=A0A2G7FTV3_9EURO|nr:hypothetical protein AARAC_008633 [Aspergillus arachidicola]